VDSALSGFVEGYAVDKLLLSAQVPIWGSCCFAIYCKIHLEVHDVHQCAILCVRPRLLARLSAVHRGVRGGRGQARGAAVGSGGPGRGLCGARTQRRATRQV